MNVHGPIGVVSALDILRAIVDTDTTQSYFKRDAKMNWFADKRIIVPIDFGEASAGAIETALQLASTPSNVHVVHIDPDLAVTSPAAMWDAKPIDERRKNVEAYYHKSLGTERFRGVSFHVEFGDPGNGIAEFAKKIGAGAIVIPSHGRTGLSRLLLGLSNRESCPPSSLPGLSA